MVGVAASPCQVKQLSRAGLLSPTILGRLHLSLVLAVLLSKVAAVTSGHKQEVMHHAFCSEVACWQFQVHLSSKHSQGWAMSMSHSVG